MTSLPPMTVAEAFGSIPDVIDCALGHTVLRRCLTSAGLPEDISRKIGWYVPEISLNRLLHTAARSAGDDLFGLHLVENLSVKEYGAWGDYVLEAPTLGKALQRAVSIIHLHADNDGLAIRYGATTTRLEYTFGEKHCPGYRQVALAALGPLLSIPRHFKGENWCPVSIGLDIVEPVNLDRIGTNLGTDVHGNEACIYLEIFNTDLSAINPNTPPSWTTRKDVVRMCRGGPPRQFVPFVEQLILERIGETKTTIDDVASMMALSRRSLQRRLDQESTNFRRIAVSAKMRRAAEYLAESPMSVSEIATLLDYSTPSHFARMFRKFYGNTPGEYRAMEPAIIQ